MIVGKSSPFNSEISTMCWLRALISYERVSLIKEKPVGLSPLTFSESKKSHSRSLAF